MLAVLSKSDGVDASLLPVGLQKLVDMISPDFQADMAAEPDAEPIGDVAAVAAAPVEDRLLDALDVAAAPVEDRLLDVMDPIGDVAAG